MRDEPIPVRLSHLLRYCAVGAVVRGPDYLVTVQDTRAWQCGPEREIQYVDRVRAALRIGQTLRKPPTARLEDAALKGDPVPATRFPAWTRCARCGLLHHQPWRRASTRSAGARLGSRGTWTCAGRRNGAACRGRLEQAPWVLAHVGGYLADVPWHWLAHRESRHPRQGAAAPAAGPSNDATAHAETRQPEGQRACGADWEKPYLTLKAATGGYEVHCSRCRAHGRLPQRFLFSERTWQQPWFREPPPEPLTEPAWVLAINDVRVHAPVTPNALVIPPESRIRRGTVVDRLHGSTDWQAKIREARPGLHRKTVLRGIAAEFDCTPEEIEKALSEIDRGYPLYGQALPGDGLLQSEYRALVQPIPDLREDEDFVTTHHNAAWSALAAGLEGSAGRIARVVHRLVAVDRLKEVLVYRGFRRLGGETVTPPDLTGASEWLPALELYGEGVFFTLDEERLRQWEEHDALQARARMFCARLGSGPVRLSIDAQVSPRFLLLHTLAHLMIRALETAAGYPAASLKERIYSHAGGDAEGAPMAGILIYVAVPDTEGSLGGLTEQAEPNRFLRLLTAAVESAAWCSMDPVCGEQEGHGPGQLNRAACHACALVPESSCGYSNVLLDRTFLAGAADGRAPGFFAAGSRGGSGA